MSLCPCGYACVQFSVVYSSMWSTTTVASRSTFKVCPHIGLVENALTEDTTVINTRLHLELQTRIQLGYATSDFCIVLLRLIDKIIRLTVKCSSKKLVSRTDRSALLGPPTSRCVDGLVQQRVQFDLCAPIPVYQSSLPDLLPSVSLRPFFDLPCVHLHFCKNRLIESSSDEVYLECPEDRGDVLWPTFLEFLMPWWG